MDIHQTSYQQLSSEQQQFSHVQGHAGFTWDPQKSFIRSKQTSNKEPWPKVINLSASREDASYIKAPNPTSGGVKLQKSSSKNKRVTHMDPPSNVSTNVIQTTRTKMRESVAASLALVCNEQTNSKHQEDNPSVEITSTYVVNKNTENGRLGSVIMPTDEHNLQKPGDMIDSTAISSTCKLENDNSEVLKCEESHNVSDSIVEDELLMQNGLTWSSCVDVGGCEIQENRESETLTLTNDMAGERDIYNLQILATKIEEELFKLFGGVNKKYKERGRSLLFNLRDQNNPELRKRVVSGDIPPERLCSMSAEELASKELSEWRIAKAEKRAQMVVLPDTEVDLKRLVKKTHKGEIQVEVERDENISVEADVVNSLQQSRVRKRKGDLELTSGSRIRKAERKTSDNGSEMMIAFTDKADSREGEDTLSSLLHDTTDYMQDILADEFRDALSPPPVPTLDEFMRDLDSQPPFGNLSAEIVPEAAVTKETESDSSKLNLATITNNPQTNLDGPAMTPEFKSIHSLDSSEHKPVDADSSAVNEDLLAVNAVLSAVNADLSAVNADSSAVKPKLSFYNANNAAASLVRSEYATHNNKIPRVDRHVWDGLIQLNISSLVTVLGFYRSGEQTSINYWPSFLEIKGRVRLDAFEKFLHELNLSRSRGIMLLQFAWKQGSPESGRLKLHETIDSYIKDERVGFAEPISGVELYFCPPHPKTMKVLAENLPKEHGNLPASIDDGLIGVVIWKRAIAKPLEPTQKHNVKVPHNFPTKSLNSDVPKTSITTGDDEDDDDLPPGFGPGTTPKVNDDPKRVVLFQPPPLHNRDPPPPPPPPSSRSVEQIRELINKYGHDETANSCLEMVMEPWNDDDDDIPEWQPNGFNPYVLRPSPPPPTTFYSRVGPEIGRWQRPAPGPRRGPQPSSYVGKRRYRR